MCGSGFDHSSNNSPNMSISPIKREIGALSKKLEQLEIMVENVNSNPNRYWNTPFTFLIITNANKSEFKVFKANVPAIKGNLQTLAEFAYISHPEMQPEYQDHWVLVIGRWNKTRWEVASGKGELSHDDEYLVIMTRKRFRTYLTNGAIFALESFFCSWDTSVLVTAIFATEFLYNYQWKRVDNEPCTANATQVESECWGVKKVVCKSKKTFLEVYFETKKTISDSIVRFVKDGSRRMSPLNAICAGADELNFNMRCIFDHLVLKILCKIGEDNYQRLIFEYGNSHNTGNSLFQVVNGINLDGNNFSWPRGSELVSKKVEKKEGKTVHHFIYGADANRKIITLHVHNDSSLLDVIPELSDKFEIPISRIGSRLVHLFEGEFVVTKYVKDVHKLAEFAAYLFE
ncbi:unnamed protein product [Bursaphelenchus xylophilus]|uniref:(pine wood nematode) hypothetical protein n=1 Tax=Bursaphelenchus xylophilus TaxID=6326 RepID=A0A1I7S664_BURXY|nr:unnamed protein product [Bursaphelenchus xylophilus]CAG9081035.1 unnamed protein product [Bursaphelenchus xylophilus]